MRSQLFDQSVQRQWSAASRFFSATAAALVLIISSQTASAGEYFRFGTGGQEGTYLPIGSLIADAINKRKIKTSDDREELVMLPQRSNGSVANLEDISDGLLEGGLAQADTINQVYQGNTHVSGNSAKATLRTVGALYLESVHLVVAVDSGIDSIEDLQGMRVSVDELGSGTQVGVETLMDTIGLTRDNVSMIHLKPDDSIDRMRLGKLDAFFMIAGYPLEAVKALVDEGVGRVVSFTPEVVDQLADEYLYISKNSIPSGVYSNDSDILSLGVSAQMIVRANIDTETVYQITKTLWSRDTLATLKEGHPRGGDIRPSTALQGLSIPLHEGARRYYLEQGYDIE